MKRILALALSVSMALGMGVLFTGCGGDSGSGGGSPVSSKPDVDLSQVEWNVESGIVDGYRAVVFGYTNNTDYEIVDFDLSFKVRDDVTSDELEQSSELKEKASQMEHDIGDITFEAMTSKCVAPGESVEGCACTLDGTIEYYTDYDSYELFEPDMMTAVIESGEKLYIAYYDYSSEKTTMGDDVEDAYTWSESDLAKALPKPEVKYLAVSIDEETSLSASAYGVSKEDFEKYVEACKNLGFVKNVETYDDDYAADNAEGIHIDLDYYSSDDEMYISADKTE